MTLKYNFLNFCYHSVIGSVVAVMGLYVFLWGKKKETDGSTSTMLSPRTDNEDQAVTNNNDSKSPV